MSRNSKILLGLATVWPILYIFIFVIFVAFMAFYMAADFAHGGMPPSHPPVAFFVLIPLHILSILLVGGLLTYYIVDLFRTTRIPNDMKALWAVVLFFGNIISMPIYWYLFIWKEPKANTDENCPPTFS